MIGRALDLRRSEFDTVAHTLFDVAIIGSGISGACLFHHLCSQGYRVLLVDKADFAGGTSQSSAMMIWGGLLYLRNLGLLTAYKLSASRDELVRNMRDSVQPRQYRYILPARNPRKRLLVHSALYFYWLMSGCRRSRPRLCADFDELAMLSQKRHCFEYEEAYVPASDARFVLQWLLKTRSAETPALNYCALRSGLYDLTLRHWFLDLHDAVLNREITARAKVIVNAAGAWTDSINAQFGIQTPHKHVLSKGVFIGVPRHPSHRVPLIFERELEDDYVAFIPWGPISLWGATETPIKDVTTAFAPRQEDIHVLLEELNRKVAVPFGIQAITSLRCGVRALVVPRESAQPANTSRLSRKYVVHRDRQLPWISIHGGKLTSCIATALAACDAIDRYLSPRHPPAVTREATTAMPELERFPGIDEPVLSAAWCAEQEGCWTLEDYLRRRTNIAQWIFRGGLGPHNQNANRLEQAALVFANGDARRAKAAVAAYQRKMEDEFDRIVQSGQPAYANS
jgi:glycerol-3-phosphate dehydrogenase